MVTIRILLALLTVAAVSAAQADRLYRYKNTDGHVVVDYRVPVEYKSAGYEVLNDDGVVLKVVPRELTEEEKLAKDAEQKLQDAATAELERLRKWDESLLLRYSTVADIEAARERALDDLRIRMSILKGNRRSLKQKVENFQAEAAEIERAGMEVDKKRINTMAELQREIGATERAIAERQRDIEEVASNFGEDIERFGQLQDMVELRRTMGTQAKSK